MASRKSKTKGHMQEQKESKYFIIIKMKKSLSAIAIIISLTALGQDTTFFNAEWKPTARNKAEFFRLEKKEGGKWTRTDFYITKQLQMKGTYSSLKPETEDGYF
jgi:hypothetical protein